MIPVGPIINMFAVLLGGIVGIVFKDRIPERLVTTMPLAFGMSSIAMGITMIIKLEALPPVILAVLLGTIIGELILLEKWVGKLAEGVRRVLEKQFSRYRSSLTKEDFKEQYVSIIVLFCASGTGIFGAINEGITGDISLLLSKSFLDFFTAIIFALQLGIAVSFIAFPQLLILLTLFFGGVWIMPIIEPYMIANFTAIGGIIMVATGFRISGIKSFPIVNMLPALLISIPISYIWYAVIQ